MITRYRLEATGEDLEDVRLDLDEAEYPILQDAILAIDNVGWTDFVNLPWVEELMKAKRLPPLPDVSFGDGECTRRLVRFMRYLPQGYPQRIVTEEHIRPNDTGDYEGRRVVQLQIQEATHEKVRLNEGQGIVLMTQDENHFVGPFENEDDLQAYIQATEGGLEMARSGPLWDPDTYLLYLERKAGRQPVVNIEAFTNEFTLPDGTKQIWRTDMDRAQQIDGFVEGWIDSGKCDEETAHRWGKLLGQHMAEHDAYAV